MAEVEANAFKNSIYICPLQYSKKLQKYKSKHINPELRPHNPSKIIKINTPEKRAYKYEKERKKRKKYVICLNLI